MSLAELRPIFKGTMIGKWGYRKNGGESRIAEGNMDLIACGRPLTNNPNLPEQFRKSRPFHPATGMSL